MYARATQLEIDTTRISTGEAVELFRQNVLGPLHELDGFEGVYVFANPDGKGLIVTLWVTEQAADVQVEAGFYGDILREHATIFRAAPGRERYEVVFAVPPVLVST